MSVTSDDIRTVSQQVQAARDAVDNLLERAEQDGDDYLSDRLYRAVTMFDPILNALALARAGQVAAERELDRA